MTSNGCGGVVNRHDIKSRWLVVVGDRTVGRGARLLRWRPRRAHLRAAWLLAA